MNTKWKENQRPNVEKDNEDYGDVVIVVVVVAIQSTVLSWESSIVAYFYPEKEQRKRKLNGALATARRDHRLRGLEDDALGTSQMDVLNDLVPLARLMVGKFHWKHVRLKLSWSPEAQFRVGRKTNSVIMVYNLSRQLSSSRASQRDVLRDLMHAESVS